MESKNSFYVFKEQEVNIIPNQKYDIQTGESSTEQGTSSIVKSYITSNVKKVYVRTSIDYSQIIMLAWDFEDNYIGYTALDIMRNADIDFDVPDGAAYIAFCFTQTNIEHVETCNRAFGYQIYPHYKELKKKYQKETGQIFFRESLDGKISLFGIDYITITTVFSIQDNIILKAYRDNESSAFITASFNRTDCKIDNFRKKVEISLQYQDKYSKILDAYENTYDLIKLAPEIVPLQLTKRSVAQIYIQGENIVSSYAGGTYWETDVDEPIDDEDLLRDKYHFSKGVKFVEVSLQDFNYDINAAYRGLPDSNVWNAVSVKNVGGTKERIQCCIFFNKVLSAGEPTLGYQVCYMSTGEGNAVTESGGHYFCMFDTYRIEIRLGLDGEGDTIYQSTILYGKDREFTLAQNENLYPMEKVSRPSQEEPVPANFNLGDYVIEYQIWARLLCDVSVSNDGQHTTYDLPRDDFAVQRRNYKKCIGISGVGNPNSILNIYHSQEFSDKPTSYGLNDFGEYFRPPIDVVGYYYPLARNSWANTSMWVELVDGLPHISGYEAWCENYYREYTLRNSYHIGDVIKALISQIDPSIKHEKTPGYSSFLYGHSGATAGALGNCDIYITQKTNVLKGEYDQAAQKAEIKLKQLMEMLRDCFRCYWYIDDENRLIIEHITYFMNGLSYNIPDIQLDLTHKRDKFNKKKSLYCQREIEYEKSELPSRYEFAFMDDVTKVMGGDLYVDVNNKYIQKDKVEEINVDGFTTDIDYMLFLPDDFSNDGFALILADSDKKVPIIRQAIKDEKQYGNSCVTYVQNWYASWNQLIWHYMNDMPGDEISYNNLSDLYVNTLKQFIKHSIEIPYKNIDLYKTIRTEEGIGSVESMTHNLDTDKAEIELRYSLVREE